MGLFASLGLKPKPTTQQHRKMMPELKSLVECSVKGGPTGAVSIESIGAKGFTTSSLAGLAPGQAAVFRYSTAQGKCRFRTTVQSADGKQAWFKLPEAVSLESSFGSVKRSAVRVDATLNVQWRFTSERLETEWQKGVLSNISRTGARLMASRPLTVGERMDLKLPLGADRSLITVRATTRRVDAKAPADRYVVGVAFAALSAEAEKTIADFISRRQVALRERGLS